MGSRKKILVSTCDSGIVSDLKTRLERLGFEAAGPSLAGAAASDAALVDLRIVEEAASGTASIPGGMPIVLLLPEGPSGVRSSITGICGVLTLPCTDEALKTAVTAALRSGETARIRERGVSGIRKLVSLCGEALVLTDRAGRILMLSPAAEQLLGCEPSSVAGTPFVRLLSVAGREPYTAAAAGVMEGGAWASLTLDVLRADGTPLRADLTLLALPFEGGLCGAALVRPAVGDPLRTGVRKLAHDLNNSLTAILGYTELARDSLDNGTALDEFTSEILKAGAKAQDQIARLMRFARGEP
jgi:PAS domain-containing protein